MLNLKQSATREDSAFTLIELLVVVAIIGVLAALIFPVFAGAKRSAVITQNISTLRDIYRATVLYDSDYHKLPYAADTKGKNQPEICPPLTPEIIDSAPRIPDQYARYGIPKSKWLEPRPVLPLQPPLVYVLDDRLLLLGETMARWEQRPKCAFSYERDPRRRGGEFRGLAATLFIDGSVKMVKDPSNSDYVDYEQCVIRPIDELIAAYPHDRRGSLSPATRGRP